MNLHYTKSKPLNAIIFYYTYNSSTKLRYLLSNRNVLRVKCCLFEIIKITLKHYLYKPIFLPTIQ